MQFIESRVVTTLCTAGARMAPSRRSAAWRDAKSWTRVWHSAWLTLAAPSSYTGPLIDSLTTVNGVGHPAIGCTRRNRPTCHSVHDISVALVAFVYAHGLLNDMIMHYTKLGGQTRRRARLFVTDPIFVVWLSSARCQSRLPCCQILFLDHFSAKRVAKCVSCPYPGTLLVHTELSIQDSAFLVSDCTSEGYLYARFSTRRSLRPA